MLSATSDVLDGMLARRSGVQSAFGNQFDTYADMAMILSAPGWMRLLAPAAWSRRRGASSVLGAGALVILAMEWTKHRRLAAMHIDSARLSAVLGHAYILNLFLRRRDSDPLFKAFLSAAAFAAAESL